MLGQPSLCRLERALRVVMVQVSEQAQRAVTSLLVDVVVPATITVNDEAAVVADAPFASSGATLPSCLAAISIIQLSMRATSSAENP